MMMYQVQKFQTVKGQGIYWMIQQLWDIVYHLSPFYNAWKSKISMHAYTDSTSSYFF